MRVSVSWHAPHAKLLRALHRARRKSNAGLTRSVCPQDRQLRHDERELAVTQTGRGARHNNTSANPKGARSAADTKRAKRTTGGSSRQGVVMFNCEAIYPGPTARVEQARCLIDLELLTRCYSSTSPRNASRNVSGASKSGSTRFAVSKAFCAPCRLVCVAPGARVSFAGCVALCTSLSLARLTCV